jgi:predicted permease
MFMNWLNRIFHRGSLYNELSEELRQHLEEKTEQLMREGMNREEAEQTARRAFGNATLLEEQSRETWQWPRIENLLRDISFSARLLRKSPGFTLIAILTLTLGIGANTAIFSLLNGLLLRPLPVPDANGLVVLRTSSKSLGYSFCAPILRALESRHEVFRNVFTFASRQLQLQDNSGTEKVAGSFASGQYFDALETPPELGRTLNPSDDSKDRSPALYPAVISDAFWTTHFNRQPRTIGQKITLNGIPFTIVGVMPAGFFGFDATNRPQVWIPLITEPRVDAPYDMLDGGYNMWWLRIGARLQPGVSFPQANAWLGSAMPAILREAIPNPKWKFGKTSRDALVVSAEPGASGYSFLRDSYRSPLLLVFAFCALLLLLACINLASLLLARAALRQREIATRLALGASRRRLIQQLLIDSLLLALLGTTAGLCLAPLASRALAAMLLSGKSTLYLDAHIDGRVCLFVTAVAIISTALVGLLPALQATAGDLNQQMKDGARSTRAEHRRILSKILLAIEVALALVLVSGAGLLTASLYRLYHSGFGFDPANVVLVNMDMDRQPAEGAALFHLYQQINDRFAALPGIRSSSFTSVPPLSGTVMMSSMHAPGGGDRDVYESSISPGYLRTLRISLLDGRSFSEEDVSAKQSRVLINERAAHMFFPGGNAVGKMLNQAGGDKDPGNQIVGVVADTKYSNLRDPAPPMVYNVIQVDPDNKKPGYEFILRVSGPVTPPAAAIRRIATELAPGIPAPTLTTMDQQVNDTIVAERIMALLSVFFAVSALLVTAIGLYGVLAWSTARRTGEIGVRMALGAQRMQVVALIFRENLWTAASGCLAGLAAAILASRAIESFLYGTSPRSLWVFSAALALLCLVAAVASLIPAVRAASIDPMQALRSE